MKNKKIIIIALVMTIISCNSQDNKEDRIKSFLETFVTEIPDDLSKMSSFLKVSDGALNPGTKTYELIQFNIQFLNGELKKHNGEYEILTYETFKSREAFKQYGIKYEGDDELYCIVQENHFITPIIIDENSRIVAFFTGIVKNNDNIVPYVFE